MENLKWFVYKHTNLVNGKVYIGITHDIKKRWSNNGRQYWSNRHFKQAIEKYGWDGFLHEIVYENISYEEACSHEIELIAKYNACDREYGYNKSPGGGNPLVIHRGENHHFYGKKLSGEHRKKLSESHIVWWKNRMTRLSPNTSHMSSTLFPHAMMQFPIATFLPPDPYLAPI